MFSTVLGRSRTLRAIRVPEGNESPWTRRTVADLGGGWPSVPLQSVPGIGGKADITRPKVSIIIPTRNRFQKLTRCLDSVIHSNYPSLEVIVVDDCSEYDVRAALQSTFPDVVVHRNHARKLLSYSRNVGASLASGALLFFLDDDNVIDPDAVASLVSTFDYGTSVAVATPVIYRYDARSVVWTSYIRKGRRFPGFYVLGLEIPSKPANTFSFHDAFMVRKDIFEECGRFDSDVFPIHFSELDLAYRLHTRGYMAVVNPTARVWHDVGRVHMHIDRERSFYTLRNRIILLKKYASRREVMKYTICVLPFLTAYYMVDHARKAADDRLGSTLNLAMGVISGLAFIERRKGNAVPLSPRAESRSGSPGRALLENPPLVSVIVPTRNSQSTIAACLKSLSLQTYPKLEILVVDNHSTDATVSIARQFPRARILTIGPERSAQVNFGVRMARGKYVYRVDSDFVLEPDVIKEAVDACELGEYKVVTVHNTSDPTISFWSAVRKLERDCYVDDTVNVAARFFAKSVFAQVGGFDEAVIASEDYDLHNRLVRQGFRIGRISSEEVHIGEPRKLKDVVKKHVFYGKTIDEFISRNPGAAIRQLGPFRAAYLRHWKDFVKNPTLTLGFLLYQYVRYASAVAGFLSISLES